VSNLLLFFVRSENLSCPSRRRRTLVLLYCIAGAGGTEKRTRLGGSMNKSYTDFLTLNCRHWM
jgi:hypothetical protein